MENKKIEIGSVPDFGLTLIDLRRQECCIPVNQELAKIVGWDKIPTDDFENPYIVMGVAWESAHNWILVCSGHGRYASDTPYSMERFYSAPYAIGCAIKENLLSSVLNWIEKKREEKEEKKREEKEEKKRKEKEERKRKLELLKKLYKKNKVDNEFVVQRRKELHDKFVKKEGGEKE